MGYNYCEACERLCDDLFADRDRLADENKRLREAMTKVSKYLDGIKYELEASVYTCKDDEFATIFFCRDILDEALKKMGEA